LGIIGRNNPVWQELTIRWQKNNFLLAKNKYLSAAISNYCVFLYMRNTKRYFKIDNLNMITQIKYSLFISIFLVITLMTSCSDQGMMNTSLIDTVTAEDIMSKSVNRSVYNMSKEEESKVSISVIYTGDLDEILLNESSALSQAINTYHLNLETSFEIDESMKGITLGSYVEMKDPVRIGKEISNGESILMVEIINMPTNNEI
jgi:hypothetical protein